MNQSLESAASTYLSLMRNQVVGQDSHSVIIVIYDFATIGRSLGLLKLNKSSNPVKANYQCSVGEIFHACELACFKMALITTSLDRPILKHIVGVSTNFTYVQSQYVGYLSFLVETTFQKTFGTYSHCLDARAEYSCVTRQLEPLYCGETSGSLAFFTLPGDRVKPQLLVHYPKQPLRAPINFVHKGLNLLSLYLKKRIIA